jgi:ubiquinone/menaquinone biosynthesis C-methylase UbiE
MKSKISYRLRDYYSRNRALSRRFGRHLRILTSDPNHDYERIVSQLVSQIKNPLVLDIGCGKQCFLASRDIGEKKVICLDIQLNQLIANRDADHLIAGNALAIPLADHCIDIVISRSFIEHLPSVEGFFQEAYRVLRKGGYLVSFFPCKFAVFAIINQLLPSYLAKKVLQHFLEPEEELGFKAYYDKCYFQGIQGILEKNGFSQINIIDYHFSSAYFEFFLPLFLISCAYDIFTRPFRNLASYLVIVARK